MSKENTIVCPIILACAVVTRSKEKSLQPLNNSSQPDLQQTTSLNSPTSNLESHNKPEPESVDILFDLIQTQQMIEHLKTNTHLSFEIIDGTLYKLTYICR